jgi:hypothetical protein
VNCGVVVWFLIIIVEVGLAITILKCMYVGVLSWLIACLLANSLLFYVTLVHT